jgi:hypothetical protein
MVGKVAKYSGWGGVVDFSCSSINALRMVVSTSKSGHKLGLAGFRPGGLFGFI